MSLEGEREKQEQHKKELPVWLAESTVINTNSNESYSNEGVTSSSSSSKLASVSKVLPNILREDYISQLIQVGLPFG